MNERIKELIHKSTVPADKVEDYAKSEGLIVPDEKLDVEKFALLIVKECVHTVQNRGGMCGALASNWIKEHFGVEE